MGDELIRAYLSELDTALAVVPGSARARAAIVTEIGDGLADALTDQLDRGCPPTEAEQRVIDEFGDAALVAAQFVPVLTAEQVHRSALILLRTGPLVGALWLATTLLAVPLGLPIVSPVTVTAAIMVAVALVTAVPCSVFALTVTGHGIRWWRVSSRRAAAAALIAAGEVVVSDLVLLIALGTQAPALLSEPSRTGLGVVLAGLAALASLIRLTLTARNTMRLRQSRAVLGTA
jgi:hypothetical protein